MTLEISGAYLNGCWLAGTGADQIDVVNPTTEQMLASFAPAGPEQVDNAVRAAAVAIREWSATPVAERVQILGRVADELARRRDEVALDIVADVGSPIRTAQRIQAQLPVTVMNSMASIAEEALADQQVGNSTVVREPVGVVAAITPWNYPLHQMVAKIAPAVLAGATVVLKPSELAPLCVRALTDSLQEAGMPAGVVNVVHGRGPQLGPALVRHPAVDMVSFTGSTTAGSTVAALAGSGIKRVALELGGKSASLLLEDCDLERAVKVSVANAFLNGGQTCSAWTRMLVPRHLHDSALQIAAAVAESYVCGDPADERTRLGPMISAAQRTRVQGFIDAGVAQGAKLVSGGSSAPPGRPVGYFVQATVFGDVTPEAYIAQEEIFGPVLAVIPFDGIESAIEIANNCAYGLHGAVWSADNDRALGVARRLRTGSVDINGAAYNPLAPFGGYKKSGIGRELGRFGIEEYTELKSIQL